MTWLSPYMIRTITHQWPRLGQGEAWRDQGMGEGHGLDHDRRICHPLFIVDIIREMVAVSRLCRVKLAASRLEPGWHKPETR